MSVSDFGTNHISRWQTGPSIHAVHLQHSAEQDVRANRAVLPHPSAESRVRNDMLSPPALSCPQPGGWQRAPTGRVRAQGVRASLGEA